MVTSEAGRGRPGPRGATGRDAVLVLCLGNALRRDDAVALHVADALERDPPPGAVIERSGRAGLYLLDEMEGFDRVVVVDAIRTAGGVPGAVHSVALEELHAPGGPSPHAIGLPSAVAAARAAGAPAPSRIQLVAIEVADMDEIGEGLTAEVRRAIPLAVEAVREAVDLLSRR